MASSRASSRATKAQILKAATAFVDNRVESVRFDRRRRFWVVEYESDPAIYYRAFQTGSEPIAFEFDRIDDNERPDRPLKTHARRSR